MNVFIADQLYPGVVKVYVTPNRSEADLIAKRTDFRNDHYDGAWFVTSFQGEADMKIIFVQSRINADLVVTFTQFQNEAKWVSTSKKHKFLR